MVIPDSESVMTTATAPSLTETIMPEALVAELLGIEVKTLRNQCSSGHGPVFIRRSGCGVLYYAADVEAYLLSRRTTPSGLSLPSQAKTVADVSALSAHGRFAPAASNRVSNSARNSRARNEQKISEHIYNEAAEKLITFLFPLSKVSANRFVCKFSRFSQEGVMGVRHSVNGVVLLTSQS